MLLRAAVNGAVWTARQAFGDDNRAVRYRDHFLKGSGDAIVVERDEARTLRVVRKGERENQRRIVQSIVKEKDRINSEPLVAVIARLGDGESVKLRRIPVEHPIGPWSHLKSLQPLEYPATKKSDIKSIAHLRAQHKGSIILIAGYVDHVWDDKYDFTKSAGPSSKVAVEDIEKRGAKSFHQRASWRQRIRIEGKLVGESLLVTDVVWEDVDQGVENIDGARPVR